MEDSPSLTPQKWQNRKSPRWFPALQPYQGSALDLLLSLYHKRTSSCLGHICHYVLACIMQLSPSQANNDSENTPSLSLPSKYPNSVTVLAANIGTTHMCTPRCSKAEEAYCLMPNSPWSGLYSPAHLRHVQTFVMSSWVMSNRECKRSK